MDHPDPMSLLISPKFLNETISKSNSTAVPVALDPGRTVRAVSKAIACLSSIYWPKLGKSTGARRLMLHAGLPW